MSGWRAFATGVVTAAAIGVVAGCGGGAHSHVALKLTVTHYTIEKTNSSKGRLPQRVTEHFTLNCQPTSGTLPFAARICRDIARHRQAMLAPRRRRSVCSGTPFMAVIDVEVIRGASGGGFSASPGCGWPGGTPASIYYAASTGDSRVLRLLESRLRCEDNPAFFAKPTPWASVVACTRGLWTPLAERAIKAAKTSTALVPLHAAKLFPADPGVVRCRIPAGGVFSTNGPRIFYGLCGVSLTGPPSNKVVHFVETWAQGRHVFRHHWTIQGTSLVSQRGPTPPQLWM